RDQVGQVPGVGQQEWWDGEAMLSREVQGRTTRDQHGESRAAGQHLRYLDGSPNHLLEVIEHEQQLLRLEHGLEDVQQWARCTFLDAERLRNGGQDQRRITDGGQVDEEHTLSELLTEFCSHL